MVPRRRFSRRFAALVAAAVLFFLYHVFSLHSSLNSSRSSSSSSSAGTVDHDHLGEPAPLCPPLPGIEDVLVVMKTGVTEAREKVPIHFKTTLRCIPNYVIYSDFEEEIEGVKIHDVLKSMDSGVKERVSDFDIYNRIVKQGRKGLEQGDFADEANSAIGKPNNPGWKLDKWKFLPMAQEALKYKSNAKWYVFMEADTYISWPTLLTWLAKFDSNKPWYLGTETQIADVIFAHGGSGFMLSRPALEDASDQYTARRAELDNYVDMHWAGDCVLGKVLADAGINLHFTWPILQNSNIGELDEFTTDLYRIPWCYISVAFHHLNSREIEHLWKFEQRRWHDKNKRLLLHSDVFREYIYPDIASLSTRSNWDNLSDEDQPFAQTFEDCRQICEARKTCMQYSWRGGKCYIGSRPRLGSSSPTGDSTSGFLTSRIRELMDKQGICRAPEFGSLS
ncbi:uncharacterized protein N7469_005601 [Penicillium citrinum]|uniref:N-acetylgalactosaminide beta-1,3-galactosyltransferase n=1 Tax=Penicillium citrinum TaxID=5077 RepID=A0A9W9P2C7_PENCI|nr:uncharacterized protein N7469_005601 [Penicillium citrinum]KAJ5233835.1 hypothetical protein N7469_005601 [Penicillium citrinum]